MTHPVGILQFSIWHIRILSPYFPVLLVDFIQNLFLLFFTNYENWCFLTRQYRKTSFFFPRFCLLVRFSDSTANFWRSLYFLKTELEIERRFTYKTPYLTIFLPTWLDMKCFPTSRSTSETSARANTKLEQVFVYDEGIISSGCNYKVKSA